MAEGAALPTAPWIMWYDFRQEQLWLINSTVSGNVADGSGGGIYTGLGEFNRVFLDNATITANVADADGDEEGDGGGLFNRLGQVRLRNSILAANQDHSQGTQRPDCWTPRRLDSRGYNLIGDASTCPLDGITVGNLLGVDPRLGPLQDNGGSTQTHSLLAGSQAIDAGNPNGCMSESLPFADRRSTRLYAPRRRQWRWAGSVRHRRLRVQGDAGQLPFSATAAGSVRGSQPGTSGGGTSPPPP